VHREQRAEPTTANRVYGLGPFLDPEKDWQDPGLGEAHAPKQMIGADA